MQKNRNPLCSAHGRAFRSTAGLLVVAFALLHQPADVLAQFGATERAAAQALYEQGMAEMQAGNPAGACPKFEESQRLDPGVGTLLHLADCYEAQGRTASAWATFLEASFAAKSAGQLERQEVAAEHAAALKPKLSRLVLRVASPRPEGLLVYNDGKPVGQALWGLEIPVDPGEHEVSAVADGHERWALMVVVQPGPGVTELTLPALVPSQPQGPPPSAPVAGASAGLGPDPVPARSAESGSWRTAGYWLVGGGALLAAGGAGLLVLALDDDEVADAECRQGDPTVCSGRGVAYGDRANQKAGIGLVAGGVGLAALATGAVLLLTAPADEVAAASSWRVWPAVSATQLGLATGGRF